MNKFEYLLSRIIMQDWKESILTKPILITQYFHTQNFVVVNFSAVSDTKVVDDRWEIYLSRIIEQQINESV